VPADCHAKGGMTGHRWMNWKLGRLQAIGAVFGLVAEEFCRPVFADS